MRSLRKLLRRGWSDRLLCLEALADLALAKFLVHGIPFRRLAPRLGRSQVATPPQILPGQRPLAFKVSWAVQAVARHVPLRFVCLPQAIAAQRMLRRRGVPTTLYLGVATDLKKPEAITAHAWLRAGDRIVTGEEESRRHRTLAWFGDSPARS